MLPFGVSIAILSAAQAAVVLGPRGDRPPGLSRLGHLSGRAWGLVPVASIVGVVFGIRAVSGLADGLTWLALIAVPALAAVALGWVGRGGRPMLAPAVLVLFALAWAARRELPGEAAAVALGALSCVTLGALLGAVTPPRALALGIVVMAAIDTALVVSDLLGPPSHVLDAARPAAGLPQLQREQFGSAVMGYGDLFVAGLLGALVASARPLQRRAALVVLALALAMDLLFLLVDELPATVPVALAVVALRPWRAAPRPAAASWPRARPRRR